MMGQIKGKMEAAAGGMKQAGGNLLDRIRGKQQPMSRPQNPTEARAQTQSVRRPVQQQQQQPQQPQMTAEEWQDQVRARTSMPWEYKSPEMRYHEYAFDIPETRQEQPYSYLGSTLNQDELRQAYPDNMVREYATTGNPLNRSRSSDDLRQEMYSNDQRGLMSGRKPLGQPIQRKIPAGDFTLQRSRTYADLIRQHNGQPKVGPYRQN